jgi:hypothetical protein
MDNNDLDKPATKCDLRDLERALNNSSSSARTLTRRPAPKRTLLQLNMPVESIPIKSSAMTTKTKDITLTDIARELAKIASAQHKCAEQLSGLANQLTVSTKPKPKPKPPSADRHLEPNRDRHPPGYMAEYMRKWRESRKRL